jgi:hypothetical protein
MVAWPTTELTRLADKESKTGIPNAPVSITGLIRDTRADPG